MNHRKLLILGFGGHARSVADVAFASGYAELAFLDANAAPGETFFGHVVMRDLEQLHGGRCDAFGASGDAQQRRRQHELIETNGFDLVSLIAPSASIGVGSVISPGSFVGHHAHIGPMARIGRGCIINTGAIIEHESSVGEYSHVSINATIAGRSALGAFSMLGAGGIIIDRVCVVDNVTLGAGAVVVGDIKIPGTYVGSPARKLR